MNHDALLALAQRTAREAKRPTLCGRVAGVTGLVVEAHLPGAQLGELVSIARPGLPVSGEVVGFAEGKARIIPFGGVAGVTPGSYVHRLSGAAGIPVSEALLGRVIDPQGQPLDDKPIIQADDWAPLEAAALSPGKRAPIAKRFETGVRVLDSLLTCGRGQRVGLFAGAGVGKTTLIQQIARQAEADVVVFGLIGERGCEVQELMDSRALSRAVLVVSTSDRSPLERVRGALAATAVAEYFRDRGANVLLIVDSLTRFAMALREIGLAAGEPPATKGYPPSAFAALPRLLERAAPRAGGGSITGFYTVLVEGDDLSDPIADSARSLLDGHIVLSRSAASRGLFPAVDVLQSASRVAHKVTDAAQQGLAQRARALLAKQREAEELKSLGAYVPGASPELDRAVERGAKLEAWSRQSTSERASFDVSLKSLAQIVDAGTPAPKGEPR